MSTTTTITYDDRSVRRFMSASLFWGIIGMLVGVLAATQLSWWQMNGKFLEAITASNPGEWSKKEDCWKSFRDQDFKTGGAWESEWADSAFVPPTTEEDAIAAEWEKVRVKLLKDSRTMQALEAYTNREWVPKYRREAVATLAAHDWKSLKRKPGLGIKKLRILAEMFAIAAADL